MEASADFAAPQQNNRAPILEYTEKKKDIGAEAWYWPDVQFLLAHTSLGTCVCPRI